MSKKLNIEIDISGQYKVFVDDVEIGTILDGKVSLIDAIRLSSNNNANGEDLSHVEIIFHNRLGGLFEHDHKETIQSMAKAIKALKGLPVQVSMRWGLGLLDDNNEEAWLQKYGPMPGVEELYNLVRKDKK